MIRKIVHIDEEKCNGCGICVPACAEGAIKIIDGKARLAADNLCDGLGACLGDCPLGAIQIIERHADEFDEAAVENHLHAASTASESETSHVISGGCPGSRALTLQPSPGPDGSAPSEKQLSQLGQWPVQLHLVPTSAPYFQGADLLITADCVPFAYPTYHRDFLAGKSVVVGCPKLDDNRFYTEKLTELFRVAVPRSITVLRMEVPCCGGIVMAAQQALTASGQDIPLKVVTIGIRGDIVG
jgi:Fe-S-cluster-containing hydrogenase component 2